MPARVFAGMSLDLPAGGRIMTVVNITDRLDTAKVLHHGSRADIDYGIANGTPVVALCGARRRPVLPRPDWPVCEACARIAAGKR